MESEEKGSEDLQELVKKLQDHKAPDSVWDKLESALFFDDNFGQKIDLPLHKCPESAWANIVQELKGEENTKKFKRFSSLVGIAASLLIGIIFFIQEYSNHRQQGINVTTYEENIHMYTPAAFVDLPTQEAMEIIREYCTQHTARCDNEDFNKLISQLNQLTDEARQLEDMFPTYVDSEENPELIKMKVKIENTHAEVVKALMGIIHS